MPHRSRFFCSFLMLGLVAAAVACEGDGGGGTGAADVAPQLRTRTGTVTLAAEEGLVFSTGEHLTGEAASVRTADLIAFAKGAGLQLGPGEPDGAMVVPLKGGRPEEFASLADVPFDPPDESKHDLLFEPDPGAACVVLGNVTPGHARVRVTDVPGGGPARVTVEFEAAWYE